MNFKKTLFYAGVLALATGGPISLFSATDVVTGVRKSWFSGDQTATLVATPQQSSSALDASMPMPVATGSATSTDPMPTPSLAEVLRFDVTVEWVMRRWPRVSTGLPHLQLQGYRVPLVTGTGLGDVAGSLTYYFNAAQQVQQITLRGTTGDPRVLVALVAGRHHFVRRLVNDPGVVLYEVVDSSNKPAGSLKIRSAKVIKASQPYKRFEVDLEIDRPR